MVTLTQMYWLTRLDSICNTLGTIFICLLVAIAALAVAGAIPRDSLCDESHMQGKRLHALLPRFAVAALAVAVVGAFIPTTKEMAAILVIPRIANSETVQQLGEGVVELAKAWMVELAPKKEVRDGE